MDIYIYIYTYIYAHTYIHFYWVVLTGGGVILTIQIFFKAKNNM